MKTKQIIKVILLMLISITLIGLKAPVHAELSQEEKDKIKKEIGGEGYYSELYNELVSVCDNAIQNLGQRSDATCK